MWRSVLLVALGGAAGSVLRFLCSVAISRWTKAAFPWSTFCVNVIGCLCIGFFIGYLQKSGVGNTQLKMLLTTGFCGGFTTFSAFALENLQLFQNGQAGTAILYALSSMVIGILAVWAGFLLSQ